VTLKIIRIVRLCTASSCSTCALVSPWCHTTEQYSNIGLKAVTLETFLLIVTLASVLKKVNVYALELVVN